MNNRTRHMAMASIFSALSIVLKILSVNLTTIRLLNFSPITLILAGYFLGPYYGLLIGFLTDTAYSLTLPANWVMFSQPKTIAGIIFTAITTLWNLFTVSTMLWGLCGGLIKKFNFRRPLLGLLIVVPLIAIIETTINTLQMILWNYEMGVILTKLPERILNMILRIPIFVVTCNELIYRLEKTNLIESYYL
ncbi:MAG: ECF transporter S component [Bacilli bacterium]|nr:ECF transporter S component [Bacilli bacterium]MDD4076745.1 ECF transporter S component [Bacilli bacterium]MDD4388796.1 ECF transporter S component [Bacilli bacterium]